MTETQAQMYIDIGIKCPLTMKIWLPHLEEPMKAKEVIKTYPDFAAWFDGTGKENTLQFYYTINKTEFSLEFIDVEAEEEVAELLGVTITEIEMHDDEEVIAKEGLNEEDVAEFRQHINDIRKGLDAIKQVRETPVEPKND
jgi:hypothetical protein